jgi:hypothetical protein
MKPSSDIALFTTTLPFAVLLSLIAAPDGLTGQIRLADPFRSPPHRIDEHG